MLQQLTSLGNIVNGTLDMQSNIFQVIGFMDPAIDSKSGTAVSWRLQLLSSGYEGKLELETSKGSKTVSNLFNRRAIVGPLIPIDDEGLLFRYQIQVSLDFCSCSISFAVMSKYSGSWQMCHHRSEGTS